MSFRPVWSLLGDPKRKSKLWKCGNGHLRWGVSQPRCLRCRVHPLMSRAVKLHMDEG